jgi:PAS domain S-box-containing protein
MGLQLQKLQDQQKIYDLQQQELEKQKIELENGTNKLADQRKEIASQSKILEEQGQKIHRQQGLVYLLVIIIVLVVILVFNIFRSYWIKQKLSKELEIRVADRTQELNDSNKMLLTELSERRQAEKRVIESENKYRILLENLPQKIFFKNKELIFVSCNENFAKELNIKSYEINGKTDYDFFPAELAEKYRTEDFDFLASGNLMEFEISETRDERTYWTQVVKIPVKDENDYIAGIQGIFWDITERKMAELELDKYRRHLEEMVKERTQELSENEVSLKKALEAAESADQLKSAFLATMSHELRTPLNSIIGFTGMLLQELPGPLNDEQKKQLRMTQKSGRHLLSLINDILDLSKIEACQLNLSKDKFIISEVIQNVMELSRPFAQSKNLLLTSIVDPSLPEIVSDQFRVKQVIINLVNNALKFTETGSVEVKAYRIDSSLVVDVTDTGMGINAEQIKILFKPFIQIDSGTTRKHEGTGLGLSISQKLMTMLGGNITVKSEYGKGSTFSIKLPLGTMNNG